MLFILLLAGIAVAAQHSVLLCSIAGAGILLLTLRQAWPVFRQVWKRK